MKTTKLNNIPETNEDCVRIILHRCIEKIKEIPNKDRNGYLTYQALNNLENELDRILSNQLDNILAREVKE